MQFNPNRPQKERARGIIRDAIKRGKVTVPSRCQKCGSQNRPCSDGRRYIQAHHPDHKKPLLVEWLCAKCHREETPVAKGERNGQAKLTASMVREAICLHRSGLTYTDIAARMRVDRRTISRAVNGKAWLAARSEAKP